MANDESELAALRDEVHRCAGRALLALQNVELGWKRLLRVCVIDMTAAEGLEASVARSAALMRLNMGEVLQRLRDEVFGDGEGPSQRRRDLSHASVRGRVRFAEDAEHPAALPAMLQRWQALQVARNSFIHHLAERLASASRDETRSLLDELTQLTMQAEQVLAETREHLGHASLALQEYVRYLQSEAGRRDFDVVLNANRVVSRLCEIAAGRARGDGWTYLTTALHLLRQQDPEATAQMQAAFGKDWLFQLLERAADVFETVDEPLPNASPAARRTLFRLRG